MQTPVADNKVAEARFFFNRQKEENKKPFRDEPEAFGCFLSAFLSAARSVTLVLQTEAKETYDDVFPRWYEALSNEDRELLEYMKGQRNLDIHKLGAEITIREKLIPAETIPGFRFFAPPLAALGGRGDQEARGDDGKTRSSSMDHGLDIRPRVSFPRFRSVH